jgi:hypothetical protein
MKLFLFTILFLILMSCLSALTWSTDDCIDLVMMSGHFQDIKGVPCFVSSYYDDWDLPSKDTAITFLADTGSVFAIVQKNLDTYIRTSVTDEMKLVEIVGCPYTENDRDYIAFIELDFIKAQFGRSQLANLNQNQQIEFCERIVKEHWIVQDVTLDFDN